MDTQKETQEIKKLTKFQKSLVKLVFKSLLILLGTLLLYTLIGYLALPPILKNILEKKLTQQLQREVTIGLIFTNPYTLALTINDFLARERDETTTISSKCNQANLQKKLLMKNGDVSKSTPFIAFDRLYLNFQTVSIIKRAVIIKACTLDGLNISIIRNVDHSYNFSDLLKEIGEKPSAKPPLFSINNIRITNGSVEFHDCPQNKTHRINDLKLTLPFISNLDYYIETYIHPALSAVVNGSKVSLVGKTKPFSAFRETYFDINIKDINIPEYMKYIPGKRDYSLISGNLTTNARISFLQHPNNKQFLSFSGDVVIDNIDIVDRQGVSFFSLPKFVMTLLPSNLLNKVIHLSKLIFETPYIFFQRTATGEITPLSFFFTKEKDLEEIPIHLEIDKIQINDGTAFFKDLKTKTPFQTTLHPLNIKVTNFSTDKNRQGSFSISSQTKVDESINLAGTFSVIPSSVTGSGQVKKLLLPKYAPYWEHVFTGKLKSGKVDIDTDFRYVYDKKSKNVAMFDLLSASLNSSLTLTDKDEKIDIFVLPVLNIKDTSVDITKQKIMIGNLYSKKAEIFISRGKDGKINIQEFFPTSGEVKKKSQSDDSSPPWLISLKKTVLEEYKISFNDLKTELATITIANKLKLSAENISTKKNSKGFVSLAFDFNDKGMVSLNGPVDISLLSTELAVDIKDIEIKPFESYFTDRVKIPVTDGVVSAKGTLKLKYDNVLSTRFQGMVASTNFASVDPVSGENLIKWDSIEFQQVDVLNNPFHLIIKKINLSNLYSNLIINPNGSLNLMTALSSAPERAVDESPSKKQPKAKTEIRIDTINLSGGQLDFLDRSITPNYKTYLHDISARVSDLSSKESALAQINLKGKLEQYGELLITGKINLLQKNSFADIKIDCTGIELSSMAPYFEKYIGYEIRKGDFFLKMKCQIDKKEILSENHIILDQFTLGEAVESPDAVKLPIKLAIALLKNRKGEIILDISVKGRLDDPQFNLTRVIFNAVSNFIAKAATSPFALLKAIGGREDLQFVTFEPGSSDITEENKEKLNTMAKILYERPSIQLAVTGHVDPKTENQAIIRNILERMLKVLKMKELTKKGAKIASVDEIVIEPREYKKYLRKLYEVAEFSKPKNFLGLTKNLPAEEMKKLLLSNIKVTEDDLRWLAINRANRVKEYLVTTGSVEHERILSIEPSLSAKDRNVEMKIIF